MLLVCPNHASNPIYAKGLCHQCYMKTYIQTYRRTVRSKYKKLKEKARLRDLDLMITFEQYKELTSKPCHYCGNTLPEYGYGLDRSDNSLGYVVGNIVPCCADCNVRKGALEMAGFTYPRTIELLKELIRTR